MRQSEPAIYSANATTKMSSVCSASRVINVYLAVINNGYLAVLRGYVIAVLVFFCGVLEVNVEALFCDVWVNKDSW